MTERVAAPRGGGARGRADMHLHTLYSDGTMEVQALLDRVERHTELDLIAVTDHERIDGALRARELHDAGDYHFGLVVGEPMHLRFFGSSVRRQDQLGTLLEFWQPDELQELGEIQAILPAEGRQVGEVVQVKLRAVATDTGTLELTAVASQGEERWKVEFDVRASS